MGGSKIDFLDGDDANSIYSSYSSINGPTLQRQNTESSRLNAMSRFNPARSSFISKTSSKMDADSLSKEDIDSTRNDDLDFLEDNASNELDKDNGVGAFQRRNSSKFSRTGSTLSRRVSAKKSATATVENGISENASESGLHIAPLPPFSNAAPSSTPALQPKNTGHRDIPAVAITEPKSVSPKQPQRPRKHPIIAEETVAPVTSNSSKKEEKNGKHGNSFLIFNYKSAFGAFLSPRKKKLTKFFRHPFKSKMRD